MTKHWSKVQYLHQVVQNANIHIKGTHSYYSDCWDNGFEQSVVRYLLGDEISKQWQPSWEVDQLYIGDYVCIAAEAVILMGVTTIIEPIGSACIRFLMMSNVLIKAEATRLSEMLFGLECAR